MPHETKRSRPRTARMRLRFLLTGIVKLRKLTRRSRHICRVALNLKAEYIMRDQFVKAVFAAAFIAVLSGFVYTQTDAKATIKPYILADGRFTIDMPGEPELIKEDADGVLSLSYTAESEDLLVNISEFSYTDGTSMTATAELTDSMLEAFFSGVLNGMKESQPEGESLEVGSIDDIEFAGMRGKEQLITMSGIPTMTRGLIGDGRIYFIGVMSSDDAQMKRILASFKVNKQKAKASSAK